MWLFSWDLPSFAFKWFFSARVLFLTIYVCVKHFNYICAYPWSTFDCFYKPFWVLEAMLKATGTRQSIKNICNLCKYYVWPSFDIITNQTVVRCWKRQKNKGGTQLSQKGFYLCKRKHKEFDAASRGGFWSQSKFLRCQMEVHCHFVLCYRWKWSWYNQSILVRAIASSWRGVGGKWKLCLFVHSR